MSKSILGAAAATLLALALGTASGCSSRETDETLTGDAATLGSMRMELQAGGSNVTSATAVITGPTGFVPQTHEIDVAGDTGVISIFFGSLPVGKGYNVTLTAGGCSGSAPFQVIANQVTVVPVALSCGDATGGGTTERGSAQIVGTLPASSATSCDPIMRIVAAPSVQDGDGPASRIQLQLNAGTQVTSIAWSSSSRNGGSGTIGELSGATDTEVTFDCGSNGSVSLVAQVTAQQGTGTCVAQGRVGIECQHQQGLPPPPPPPVRCGDGVINQASEQCDGSALPSTAPAGSTCSATCTLVTPARCGDGVIQSGEECDGAVLPVNAPAGSICNAQCKVSLPDVPANPCAACVAENCADQRAVVDANPATAPILDCALGANWRSSERVASGKCASGDLLTCYCGTTAGQDCSNAAPSALNGLCVQQVLAGTGCSVSSCVAPIFLNPANNNGKAMQFAQCWQDFCYDLCFTP